MPKKILVVDDDPEYRDYLVMGLQLAGFEVVSASNGQKGLELVASVRPDLLLLDLNMPVMHGFEVCEKVRSDPSFALMKVIISSSKSYQADIKKAKTLGADLYMIKPFEMDKLVENIRSMFNGAASK